MTKDDFISDLYKLIPDAWDEVLDQASTFEDQLFSTEQSIGDLKQNLMSSVNRLLDRADGIALLRSHIEQTDWYRKLGPVVIDFEALTTMVFPNDIDMAQKESIRTVIDPKVEALKPILSAYNIDCSTQVGNILVELLASNDIPYDNLMAVMELKNAKIDALSADIIYVLMTLGKLSLTHADITSLKIVTDSALVLAMGSQLEDSIDLAIADIESLVTALNENTFSDESIALQKALDILTAYKIIITLANDGDEVSAFDEFTSQGDFDTVQAATASLRQLSVGESSLESGLLQSINGAIDTLDLFQLQAYPVTFAIQQLNDFDTGLVKTKTANAQPFIDYASSILSSLDTDSATLLPETMDASSVISASEEWLNVINVETAPSSAQAAIDFISPSANEFLARLKGEEAQAALDTLLTFTEITDTESGINFLYNNRESLITLLSAIDSTVDFGALARPYLESLGSINSYEYKLDDSTDLTLFILDCFADNIQSSLPDSLDDTLGEGGLKNIVGKLRALINFLQTSPVRFSILKDHDISALFVDPVVLPNQSTANEIVTSSESVNEGTNSGLTNNVSSSVVIPATDIEWVNILVILLEKVGFFDAVGIDEDSTAMIKGLAAGEPTQYWQEKYWHDGNGETLLDKFNAVTTLIKENINLDADVRPLPNDFTLENFVTRCFDFIEALSDSSRSFIDALLSAIEDTLLQFIKFINYLKLPKDIATSWPVNMFFNGENYNLLCLFLALPACLMASILDLLMTAVVDNSSPEVTE